MPTKLTKFRFNCLITGQADVGKFAWQYDRNTALYPFYIRIHVVSSQWSCKLASEAAADRVIRRRQASDGHGGSVNCCD